jgi:hypothetical protein
MALLQAMLPGTRPERSVLYARPTGGGDLALFERALPAPACPSPVEHPTDRS